MNKSGALPTARQLLEAALFAMNKIPNTRLDFGGFAKTYDLAAAIERALKGGAV